MTETATANRNGEEADLLDRIMDVGKAADMAVGKEEDGKREGGKH
jgi:hypothetical protein